MGITMIAIECPTPGEPVIVVYVHDTGNQALTTMPAAVYNIPVVVRHRQASPVAHTTVLGNDGDTAGADTSIISKLSSALTIAAPLVIFGGLVYATTRDPGHRR